MSSKRHSKRSTQRIVQLLGNELVGIFKKGPYPPNYILAVLPRKSGSANELLVRSNMEVGPVEHEDLYNLLDDKCKPGKKMKCISL